MVKIGLLSTLVGPYQLPGEDGVRGARLALHEFRDLADALPIELHLRGTNAMPSSATDAANELLGKESVDFIVGPLSGDEGVAIREMAKQYPQHTFINGASASQEATLYDPAPNFYTFSTNGTQWTAGLGSYCYNVKGYRNIVTLAEAYSFPYAQVGGLALEFCRVGGKISKMLWCALGTQDYTRLIDTIPADADAIYTTLGGTDGLNFLQQQHARGGTLPIVAGSICADSSLLQSIDSPLMEGVLSSGPIADDNPAPAWRAFVDAYHALYPEDGLHTPSLFAFTYYVGMKAALLALQAVDGDLSDGQARFKDTLQDLQFETPVSPVRLDHNRAAIASVFLSEIYRGDDGKLRTHLLQEVPEVNNTLGMDEAEYRRMGRFSRENMPCKSSPLDLLQQRLEELRRRRGD